MLDHKMDEPAVVLKDVERRFGKVEAVKNMSLAIGKGEFVAFIGPSGCGKTTTLRLIAGLEQPTGGMIWINGRNVTYAKPWDRGTPMVWQNFALFPFLDVRKNIEFGLRRSRYKKNMRREMVDRALEMVGIPELANREISELSGGQKQRVGLARALVTEPTVLLLDEPMGALDANLRVHMQSELRGLQRRLGITFIYVTHNQSEAFAMADRVAVMNEGKIRQVGSPQAIYRQPKDRFVAEFVGVNNIFSGKMMPAGANNVRITTDVGEFEVSYLSSEPCPTGSSGATFLISADRVVTAGEGELRANRVVGKLTGIEFVGTLVTLLLELDNGNEFRIQKQEYQMRGIPTKIGETLVCSWGPEDAYLLPDEG
jgi:spermidine/putrescine transport system ATP-binding protein